MAIPTFTAGVSPSIVDLVGDTPLIRLRRIERDLPGVELYAKAEWQNPGGSVKDRPALRMIQEGIASGQLVAGKVILDATSGNTGIAYAMMGAAMGYSVTLCVPENVTPERKRILPRLRRGARLHQSARRVRRGDPHGAANERRGPREVLLCGSIQQRLQLAIALRHDRSGNHPAGRDRD
jgi:cysteine synthase